MPVECRPVSRGWCFIKGSPGRKATGRATELVAKAGWANAARKIVFFSFGQFFILANAIIPRGATTGGPSVEGHRAVT